MTEHNHCTNDCIRKMKLCPNKDGENTSVDLAMRIKTSHDQILFVMLVLILSMATPAPAMQVAGPVGPYNVSFYMNTTSKYDVMVNGPFSGITSTGVKFTRYNLSIDGDEGLASIILTNYEKDMPASINANKDVVLAALISLGCSDPKLYPSTIAIDGHQGVFGNCKHDSGDTAVVVSYSPDARMVNETFIGRTDCRIVSTFPWEIARDMLYTLHVEVIEIDPQGGKHYDSEAGDHSCSIGTPGISEFVINWTDNKNYENINKDIFDDAARGEWKATVFRLAAFENAAPTTETGILEENYTLAYSIYWNPNEKDPYWPLSNIKSDEKMSVTDLTIQGKKAILEKFKQTKSYQGPNTPPIIIPAQFVVLYHPDDHTYVRIDAPASEWNDSEFRDAMISLKITPPEGYY
jgi:hypothetical protein